ncbi:MAG: MBL fold metallo-hydrolase [Chloroflexi bacterium]|nr:MBL fold metallo-hydrolase [Chloroflexota bacterium]
MRRERIAEDIFVFTSDLYAQVNAGVILTSEGTIIIDTLPFPQETRELLTFARQYGSGGIRYVINTHYHSDHTYGTYLFSGAEVISHRLCREKLLRLGEQSLTEAKRETPALAEVELRIPNMIFDNEMYLHLGARSLRLIHLPGHTPDSIGVFVEGDKILFAADALLPVPYIVWGDREQMAESLRTIKNLRPDSVIQGHGQIILRGELGEEVDSSIAYLTNIYQAVKRVLDKGQPEEALGSIDIEECGKSRIPLDGLVRQLHRGNLIALYRQLKEGKEKGKARSQ